MSWETAQWHADLAQAAQAREAKQAGKRASKKGAIRTGRVVT
jgi:hypothetical protein